VPLLLGHEPLPRHLAYADVALGIAEGQTISQPYVVAMMTVALAPRPDERVLEIGTGSGYQTAILAQLAGQVVSVERHASLSMAAAAILGDLGYRNIALYVGDGSAGWPAGAPYDAIMVTAAGPRVPSALYEQLAVARHARLVMPVGTRADQSLLLVQRWDGGRAVRNLGAVRFVPLVGSEAWPAEA
jgi:protein-L-isoaspartate(D-aspartate) O-methyltransferase